MVGKLEMLKVRNKTQEGRFRVRNISKLFSTIISKALSTSISKKYPCIWHLYMAPDVWQFDKNQYSNTRKQDVCYTQGAQLALLSQ